MARMHQVAAALWRRDTIAVLGMLVFGTAGSILDKTSEFKAPIAARVCGLARVRVARGVAV